MADVAYLPERPTPNPDRLIGIDEFTGRGGASVEISLDAALRWSNGFDPDGAAAYCLLATGSFKAASEWWRAHISEFRADLCRRHVRSIDVDRLANEYLARTRSAVKALQQQRMSREDWLVETVCSILPVSRSVQTPAKRPALEARDGR